MASVSNLKANFVWSVALVLLLLSGGIFAISVFREHCYLNSFKTRPFTYDRNDVAKVLREGGIAVDSVDWLRRDAFGTKLLAFISSQHSPETRLVTITSTGLSSVVSPGSRAFTNREGAWVAWTDDYTKGVHFRGGELLELPEFALFDIDPGGDYFIIGDPPNSAWLGRIASPSQKVRIASDVLGMHVFAGNGKIYVCGQSYRMINGNYDPQAVCLTVKDEGGQFRVLDRKSFQWASGVVDVDPFSERLLLQNKSDLFPTIYLYDLGTGKRYRVGNPKSIQVFLVADLLNTLKHQ